MPPSRGGRIVHELSHDSRKGKKMETKPGAPLLLWGGIAAAVLVVVVVLFFLFTSGSGPQRTEDQLNQDREKMIQQLQQNKKK